MMSVVAWVTEAFPFVLGGMFVLFILVAGAIQTGLKESRDAALADVARLSEELGRARSAGADLVQKVGWRRKRLMNREEYRIYRDLERIVRQANAGHLLFPQVSYGAFLEATSRADLTEIRDAAFHAVARKRADFLIVDRFGSPVAVIEYQGDGHYRGNAHDRDQAKRVACRRANLPFIELPPAGLTDGQRIDLQTLLGNRGSVAAE